MSQREDTKPWYRQFWFLLVIGLPLIAVLASIHLVKLAHEDADDMVVDNYYKEGKGINRMLDQDIRAAELGMAAALSFKFASSELMVSVDGNTELPSQLELRLLHPMEADRDQRLVLEQVGAGHYRAELGERLRYSYHIQLQPVDDPDWRLNGKIDFRHTNEATLVAE